MGTLVVNLTQPRIHLREEAVNNHSSCVLRAEQLSLFPALWLPAMMDYLLGTCELKTNLFFPKPCLSRYFITSAKMEPGQHWASSLEHSVLEHRACSTAVAKYMFTNLGKQEEFD